MAVRTTDEIMQSIRSRFPDATDDETLEFIEDISDTLNDFSERTQDNTNWRERYEALDEEWRNRYRERFFNGSSDDDSDEPDEPDEPQLKTRFEELFS